MMGTGFRGSEITERGRMAAAPSYPVSRSSMPTARKWEEMRSFSDALISFSEMASALVDDMVELDTAARFGNYLHEHYLLISRTLEKVLLKLGSCCITKAVLEQKGFSFPDFAGLCIAHLYERVSFHFRKCHAAIREVKNKDYQFWAKLVEMECRWYTLADRLRATQVKITEIREGKIDIDKWLKKQQALEGKGRSTDRGGQMPAGGTSSVQTKALPVMGDVIRKLEAQGQMPAPETLRNPNNKFSENKTDIKEIIPAEITGEKERLSRDSDNTLKNRKSNIAELIRMKKAAMEKARAGEQASSADPVPDRGGKQDRPAQAAPKEETELQQEFADSIREVWNSFRKHPELIMTGGPPPGRA